MYIINRLYIIIHAKQLDIDPDFWDCGDSYKTEHYHNIYYSDLSQVSSNGSGYIGPNPQSSLIFQSLEDDGFIDVNAQLLTLNYNSNKKTDLMFITDNSSDYGFYEYNFVTNRLDKINSNKNNELRKPNYIFYTGDFNGDGLTDLFYYKKSNGNNWRLSYGIGSDFSEEFEIPNFNFGQPEPNDIPDESHQDQSRDWLYILDLNADGKSDLVWYTYENGYLDKQPHYYLFTSYGYNKFKYWDTIFTSDIWVLEQNYLTDQGENSAKKSSSIDFNGDGNSDFMATIRNRENGNYSKRILTFNFEDNDLHLITIYDGFNNKTEISYEPISKGMDEFGNANPYKKGINVSYPLLNKCGGGYVATSVQSYSSDDFLNPNEIINYTYEGGLSHLEGKGFLGFKKITKKSPDLENLNNNFQTDIINELDDSKFVLNTNYMSNYLGYYIADDEEPNFGWNKELISEKVIVNTLKTPVDGGFFIYQSQIDNIDYLNNTKSRNILTVDDWGNITSNEFKLGDNFYSPTMKITVSNEYEDKNTQNNIYKNIKLIKSTISQNHKDDKLPNDVLSDYSRTTNYYYDEYINNYNLKSVIYEVGTAKALETVFKYDKFGNILKTNLKPLISSGLSERYSTSKYDAYGRFTKEAKNALGYKEEFNYNLSNGNLLNTTDINGIKTEYEYKGFSKLYKEIIPELSNSEILYNTRWSNSTDPDGTLFVTEISGTDMPESSVFYDPLGRGFISRTTSYFPVKTIETKKEFHLDGRISKEYKPYILNTIPKKFIEYGYDDYKRILVVKDINQLPNPPLELVTEFNYDNSVSNSFVQSTKTPDNNISYSRYDAAGLLTESEDSEGNKVKYLYKDNGNVREIKTVGLDNADALSIIIDYDNYGNQTSLIDMDAGEQNYDYNAFGEIIKEEHPTGSLEYEYDILGRIVKKKTTEITGGTISEIDIDYVNSGKGLGQIKSIETSENINEYYHYDNLGRIVKTVNDVQGKSFEYEYTYKSNGFPETVKYPTGIIVKNEYNSFGYLQKQFRTDIPQVTLWELISLDENENITEFRSANGNSTTKYTYDELDYLTKIETYKTSDPTMKIQDLEYEYYNQEDESGLLKIRKDNKNNQSESFIYDNLNRLSNFTTNNGTDPLSITTMTYFKDGSIKSKTGMGNYYYNDNPSSSDLQEPVHAVKAVAPITNPKPNHTITYTAFNSIKSIEEGLKKSVFHYGADEQRIKMEYFLDNTLQYTKYYIGDYELTEYSGNLSKEVTYIDGNAVNIKNGQNDITYYNHTDNLGSLQSLSDENGDAVAGAEYSYNPWGILRNQGNWLQNYPDESGNLTFAWIGRGFTGHEHMTEFGLINMNGRVYDPLLGQFMQADNYIQLPNYSQSYNRFSYCLNNPVNFTDPSGELIWLIPIIVTLATIAEDVYNDTRSYGWDAGLNTLANSLFMAGAGYVLGMAAGEILGKLINLAINYYNNSGINLNMYSDPSRRIVTPDVLVEAPKYVPPISRETLAVIRNAVAIGAPLVSGIYATERLRAIDNYNENPGAFEVNPATGEPNYNHNVYNPSTDAPENMIIEAAAGNAIFKVGRFALGRLGTFLSKSKVPAICFVAGTMILTSDGLVEIEKIKTGDSVWSYNIEAGKSELALVENIFERSTNEFVKLYFDKDSVICTFEHPFFVNYDWKEAKDLKLGDSLFAFSGYKVALDSIFTFRTDTATAVYNLEADGNHNYYVSASGVLVHNQCAEKFLYFGKNKIANSLFHGPKGIKNNILKKVGEKKYAWKVGDNPDVKIIDGIIHLTGTEKRFKGKSLNTGLKSFDYFGF